VTRARVWTACAAIAITLAGCGDPALWARWRAERGMWIANRRVERIDLRPSLATDGDWNRAAAAFDAVARAFPVERWSVPGAPGRPAIAREVAVISGRARLGRATLDFRRGRSGEAAAAYADIFARCGALPEIAREAAAGYARALARDGRESEALGWWDRLSRDFDLLDPASGEPVRAVLDGVARAAETRARDGDAATADSVRSAAVRRLEAAIAARGADRAGEAAYRALAGLRLDRGDAPGYRAAMRSALTRAGSNERAALVAREIAQVSLARGDADTAIVYAGWTARGFGGAARLEGMRLEAHAWEAAGSPDSALAAWTRLLEAYPKAQDAVAESRFHRGALFESLGRWEQARSELRALVASQPSHPLALAALERIVDHHVRAGELELAKLEGRRAVEVLDYLISTQHDPDVQRAARRTRARILVEVEDWTRACDALADVWLRWPGTPAGDSSAWEAAGIAAGRLHDRRRADSLLTALAAGGSDSTLRAAARTRIASRERK
jgi:tetratricopeptide (TPR) repeat protein